MGKSRARNTTKAKTKARQASKKSNKKNPKSIIPNSTPTTSTTNELNPKSTNTYDRPPSPINEQNYDANHDTISDASDKSPSNTFTYKEVAKDTSNKMVTEKPKTTSFHLCKDVHDRTLERDFSDEDTVSNTNSSKYSNQRLSMMFSIPSLEKGIDEDEAPLEAIRQVNQMLHSLVNKVPSVRFGPWSGIVTKLNNGKLRTEISRRIRYCREIFI